MDPVAVLTGIHQPSFVCKIFGSSSVALKLQPSTEFKLDASAHVHACVCLLPQYDTYASTRLLALLRLG